MRFGRLLPALSVLFATGALIVLTGTGAAASQPGRTTPAAGKASLAAPASLDSYLRSLGVSRASLVTQRGTRNYAGPNCPGKGWNCTTATRVLQIASLRGGRNRVDCPGASVVSTSPQSCTFVQSGARNTAKCFQHSTLSDAEQHCTIGQTGTRNEANVQQVVHADDSATQTAEQTAVVSQSPPLTGTVATNNKSSVHQEVKLHTADGSTQSQTAVQSAAIEQVARGTGDNDSNVNQDQHLWAFTHGSSAIQNQNTGDLGAADCAPLGPLDPNACANVKQTSDNGDNRSRLKQSIKEDLRSQGSADQAQGASSGGLDGVVHQKTGPLGSADNNVDQDKHQDMSAAPGGSHVQVDPIRCCGVGSQDGGTGNSERISQNSDQKASDGDAFQQINLTGESVTPTGGCFVRQTASNNSADANNSAAFSPCPFLVLGTFCENGGESEGGFCTESEPITTPPCDEICLDFAGPILAILKG